MRKRHLFNLTPFKGIDLDTQDLLIPLIDLCRFPEETVIFKQGQAATHLYILESGTVEILFKPFDGPELTVSRIISGGVFGWSTTLGRDGYTSAAKTCTDVEAYRITGKELQRLCEQYPQSGVVILDRLASAIAERLEGTHLEIMSILNQGMELGYNFSNQDGRYDK